eukprot:GHRR01016455.1.p1 GENE.GHRR01016455.1~~GHRR01016455.1.p1  ORF type:complete len:837 (+),score=247.46 GHRR01016455.1:1908-4418(+)
MPRNVVAVGCTLNCTTAGAAESVGFGASSGPRFLYRAGKYMPRTVACQHIKSSLRCRHPVRQLRILKRAGKCCCCAPAAVSKAKPLGSLDAPLLDAVIERANRLHDKPFHVPGHKRGRALDPGMRQLLGNNSTSAHGRTRNPLQYDLTELAGKSSFSQLGLSCDACSVHFLQVCAVLIGLCDRCAGQCLCHTAQQEHLMGRARNCKCYAAHQTSTTHMILACCSLGLFSPTVVPSRVDYVCPLRHCVCLPTGLDFLSSPIGVIQEAQQLAATAFGADHTWFLVNGCSAGIHAAVMATVKPGQTLLLARNCHLAAFAACVLAGCMPLWLQPEQSTGHGIAHCVTPNELKLGLKAATLQGLGVGAVLIVSPTYFGAVARVEELAAICHGEGVPLLVDEAHGGHLSCMAADDEAVQQEAAAAEAGQPEESTVTLAGTVASESALGAALTKHADTCSRGSDTANSSSCSNSTDTATAASSISSLSASGSGSSTSARESSLLESNSNSNSERPIGALAAGADLVMHSSHKVLTAMTQSAMLHLQGTRVDPDRISKALQVLQTSSPSYILLSSLDAARRHAITFGSWATPLAVAAAARAGLAKVPAITLFEHGSCSSDESIAGLDPLRIVVNVSGLALSGFEAASWLEEHHSVVPELATAQLVVFVVGPGSIIADATSLVAAFQQLSAAQLEAGRASGSPDAPPAHLGLLQQQQQGTNCDKVSGKSTQGSIGAANTTYHVAAAAAADWAEIKAGQVPKRFQPAAMTPRDAFFTATECVPLQQATGRISAELLCPYPPGVPVLFPGEHISAEVVQLLKGTLKQGGVVTGARDSKLQVLLVLAE